MSDRDVLTARRDALIEAGDEVWRAANATTTHHELAAALHDRITALTTEATAAVLAYDRERVACHTTS